MSRASNGTYTAPASSWNPAVEGTVVDETDFNALLNDIETALTDSLSKSGLGKVTAHIDFDETTVSSPDANVGRLYVKDVGGVTSLFFKDSAGTDTNILLTSPGLAYSFSTSTTTTSDPGAGVIRFNNATLASVTEIAIDDLDANGADLSVYILSWDDALNGKLIIQNRTAPANVAIFTVSGSSTDESGWTRLAVTYVTSNGSFAASAPLAVSFSTPGATGATGSTGATGAAGTNGTNGTNGSNGTDPGIRWLFDTTTAMADPGSGDLRLNNATLASVTAIAVSDLSGETGNPDVSSFVLAWDDSTTTALRGTLILKKASAPQNFAIYNVTGASTDNVGWTELAVTHVQSSGSFSAADVLAVQFTRAGDKGTDGAGAGDVVGPASATDGRAALFDGATGKLIKALTATGIIKAASGVLSAASVGPDYGSAPINLRIAASVATNAMTIALKDLAGSDPSASSAVLIPTATISSSAGYSTWGSVTGALSVVIPSGTTIGTASAVASPVYVYAINNAGTIELAVSLKYHGPSGTVTTVAISGGATSTVMYSTTARTSVGFTCIGVVYQSQTTAGTWATAPSSVETAPFPLKKYAWSAYLSSNQTGIASTVETQINFNTEKYDDDGMYDNASTYKATIREPGLYDVTASVGSNSGYQAAASILKNSATRQVACPPATGFLGPSAGSGLLNLVPGDTLYVTLYQATGTDAAYGNATWTFFAGRIVR